MTAPVGHNGAGKTTPIKLLLGLIRPTEGSVRTGIDPAGNRGAEARRAIGFLPESVAFHGAMTGSELMAFHARLKGESCRGNAALLEVVGIAHAANRRVATYSKGMRQRLGIAQALIGALRLLLFDEPTSGLDPASRSDVYRMIDALRIGGATVLRLHACAGRGAGSSTGS
ncbi:MAG: ABC transporter ATP-binding protein [Burkholderiaceae bacterium]